LPDKSLIAFNSFWQMIIYLNSLVIGILLVCGQVCYRHVQVSSLPCINFMYLRVRYKLVPILATNISIESIYCEWTGRIFNSLTSCRQETFLPAFIILTILF
jgi:hypothetical protein